MKSRSVFIAETLFITLPVTLVALYLIWILSGAYVISDFVNVSRMIERGKGWVEFLGVGYAAITCLVGLAAGWWLSYVYIIKGSKKLNASSVIPFVLIGFAVVVVLVMVVISLFSGDTFLLMFAIGLPLLVPLVHLILVKTGKICG